MSLMKGLFSRTLRTATTRRTTRIIAGSAYRYGLSNELRNEEGKKIFFLVCNLFMLTLCFDSAFLM